MATNHIVEEVEEPLEDITDDCFVYEGSVENNEESDKSGADDDKTTTYGTHECDGEVQVLCSSSATSDVTAVTEFLPLEKAKSIVGTILGFLHDQESLYKKTNVFKKKIITSFVGNLYHTKVTKQT